MTQMRDEATKIIMGFRDNLPNDCQTAVVIDRGAPVEIIRVFAFSEGYDDLASALFDIIQVEASDDSGSTSTVELADLRAPAPNGVDRRRLS